LKKLIWLWELFKSSSSFSSLVTPSQPSLHKMRQVS
ncbi:hypothetical protein A2U01_0092357, partial [Trifolium medium]|nr:hypothetical protein [Trifolium medium]